MSAQGTFICYRREDSQGEAGRIDDRLRPRYGRERVFRDVHDSRPGVPFPDHLRGTVWYCRVALVVIGKRWVELLNARRDQADDWVRIEVETALASPGVTVIPVLVQGATMPGTDDLPDGIRALAYITAHELRDGRPWDDDMNRLIALIDRMVPPLPGQPPPRGTDRGRVIVPVVVLAAVAGIVFAVMGGITAAVLAYHSLNPKPTPTPTATPTPTPTATPTPTPTATPTPTPTPPPTPAPLARFVLVGSSWSGDCNANGCGMTATFRNDGGEGTASATFGVWDNQQLSGPPLAICTVPVPDAHTNGYVGAGCPAQSLYLRAYFNAHPQGPVWQHVTIDNPSGNSP
jgi:hypothetical protein